MDISLLVYALDNPSSSYNLGDVVDVSYRHYESCSHDKFILIHIEGIPETAPLDKVFKRFKDMLEMLATDEVGNEDQKRKREWKLDPANSSSEVMAQMINNRETLLTWEVAKNFLGKRFVHDFNAPELDTLINITDGDV